MTSYPSLRAGRGLPARAALTAAALALAGVAAAPAISQAATMTTLYVSPTGSGTACSAAAPCSLTQAKSSVEASDGNMSGDIVVQLAGGTYRLSAPLVLNNSDSGTGGHNVIWQAAPGASPVLSGGQQVTGWTLHDSANNIYSASVPAGTDSRQLYIDGAEAPRAAISLSRSDVTITYSGMTINNSALNYLAGLPEQNRIEVESQNSFTDHFAPVQSISGNQITMQQPSWQNNNWGYDTLASPFAGGQMFLENSYSFLQSGQWYLDPSAGQLYYKAPSGWNPSSHDVELPRLTSLVDISGNSVDNPVHNIAFQGITFEHTTWLAPSSNIGYADQQSGTFFNQAYSTEPSNYLSSCQSGCTGFEATRESLGEAPAAVQVSAAGSISFTGDTFTHLGEVGLGIGQDNNAVASGVGLGASSITADHNTFTDDGGAGIVVGGTQTNAHHPSDPAMTDQNITLTNNLVNGVAEDYKDMAGILSTYVTHAVIDHNEVENLPYDGIDIGWGWGMNDAGGSNDYANRGTYNYQPRYTTPTTLKNTDASYNKIHATKKIFHDGGSLYNLSANPSATFNDNYIYDNHNTVGLYLDEGSRYVTLTNNVVQDSGVWAFTNANSNNNTNDNAFNYNWYNGGATQVATGSPHNNTLTGNVQVSGYNWPSGAQTVINQSGVGASGVNTVTVTSPGNQSDAVGTPINSLQVQATDSASGQTLTFSATGLPPGLSISSSGLITGTPTSGGTFSPVVTAKDTTGSSGSTSFTWSISGGSTGSTGPLHAVGAGKCLDDPNSSTTGGTQQQIYTCSGGANQTWTHTSSGALSVTINGTTMCLDANGQGTTNGTKAIIWSCNGQSNQQWNFNSNGTITGAQSGLCLDVTGASTANGALVELWACNGGSNQQWTLG